MWALALSTIFSMMSSYSAGKAKTEALRREGSIKVKERAKRTKAIVAQQKVAFLKSGISLTGEGTPQALFEETFDVGQEDINLIAESYSRGIGNVMADTRSQMIGQLGNFASKSGLGQGTRRSSVADPQGTVSTQYGNSYYPGGYSSMGGLQ